MKLAAIVVTLLVATVSFGQIKKKLSINEAMRLRPGEIVRYFKTRPWAIENGLPYQVLIIVKPDWAIVKTNKWEFHMKLNEKQQESLKEDLKYLSLKSLNMFKNEKEVMSDKRYWLDMYLTARKGKELIRWNNKTHSPRGAVSLIEALEVYHYFGKETMEKDGG